MYVRNAWYVAATPDEIARPARPDDLRATAWCSSAARRRRRGARGFLPASRRAAVARLRSRRRTLVCGYHGLAIGCDGTRVSMPGQRVAAFRRSAVVPGDRALRLHLGMAGRRRAPPIRPRMHHAALGGERRLGLWRRPVPRRLRLSADDRQPDGPDPRDLCPRHQHRPEGDRRGAGEDPGRGRGGRSPAASWTNITRRRSGGRRCAAPACRTTCRSIAGRSAASAPPSHVMIEVGVALAGKGGYDAPADAQGVEHRGRLHHARDRDVASGISGAWRATSTSATRR